MFRCKRCNNLEFSLQLRPEMMQSVTVSITPEQEVEIGTPGRRFIADLAFINQFGTCSGCGAVKCWEYYFPA